MLLKIAVTLLIFCSCQTIVPFHKIVYTVDPVENALCQLVDKFGKKLKKPICYAINYKYTDGTYKFLSYGGYNAISMTAIREVLLKNSELEGEK